MKTIIIRLLDVEAAMLVKVQKRNKAFRDLQGLMQKDMSCTYARFKRAD